MIVNIYRKNVAVKYLHLKVTMPNRLSLTGEGLFCENGRATPEIVEITMDWQLLASIHTLMIRSQNYFFFLKCFAYAVFSPTV